MAAGCWPADDVYWPARDKIYVFDQPARPSRDKVIDLAARGLSGGNLLLAGGRLLIATAAELVALDRPAERTARNRRRGASTRSARIRIHGYGTH